MEKAIWYWDEMKLCGADYTDNAEVQGYDEWSQRFRNLDKEADIIRKALSLSKNSVVWEIGTGTGELPKRLSSFCKKIYASDPSRAMLSFAEKKIAKAKITNVEFQSGSFLKGFEPPEKVDAVVSQAALHHLPAFWTMIAIQRISSKLKSGGRFFLKDIIYEGGQTDYDAYIESLIEDIREKGGDLVARRTVNHIKDEYSLFDWILERIFEENGLSVLQKSVDGIMISYTLEKE